MQVKKNSFNTVKKIKYFLNTETEGKSFVISCEFTLTKLYMKQRSLFNKARSKFPNLKTKSFNKYIKDRSQDRYQVPAYGHANRSKQFRAESTQRHSSKSKRIHINGQIQKSLKFRYRIMFATYDSRRATQQENQTAETDYSYGELTRNKSYLEVTRSRESNAGFSRKRRKRDIGTELNGNQWMEEKRLEDPRSYDDNRFR